MKFGNHLNSSRLRKKQNANNKRSSNHLGTTDPFYRLFSMFLFLFSGIQLGEKLYLLPGIIGA